MLRYSIYVCALVALLSSSAAAQTDEERYFQRRSLEGVRHIEAGSFPVGGQARHDGLDDAEIKKAMQARLARAGVPVVTVAGEEDGYLTLTLVPKFDARLKLYLVSITLDLREMATINRTQKSHSATTWTRSDVVMTDKTWNSVRDSLAAMIDEFIKDYLASNTGQR